MTDALDGSLAGFVVERWITRAGGRGIAIASDGDGRCLVSVLDGSLEGSDAGLVERRPWDLRLVRVARAADGGTILTEALPDGDPSTTSAIGTDAVPPFALELARRVVTAHAGGELAGPLHPALVFVTLDGRLAATAQRVLRLAPAAPAEGRAPLFASTYRAPAELRGDPASAADDVFRLAAVLWRWRHGVAPFGTGIDELQGAIAGRPVAAASDAVDRLLVRAFSPSAEGRPSSAALLAALEGPAISWTPAPDTVRTPPRP